MKKLPVFLWLILSPIAFAIFVNLIGVDRHALDSLLGVGLIAYIIGAVYFA